MANDIDIEEHSVFDNPQLRNIFPNIVQLKREIDEDTPEVTNEEWNLLRVKQEGTTKSTDRRQQASITDVSLPNTSKYDANLCGDIKVVNKNTYLIIEVPNIKIEVTEDQTSNYNEEYNAVTKEEVLHCMVCFKESEEKMCKQCVLERAFPVVSSTKNVPENIKFKTASEDESGMEQHKDKRNSLCHYCDYKSADKSKLIAHLIKHNGENLYKCDNSYTENVNLNKHIKGKHTIEKNYACDICEYKCVTKSKLNAHFRKHTGEKPYKCEICDYKCSDSSSLKRHIRAKHEFDKRYSCDVCDYKSVNKSDLNVHFRKHTGEKPYECEFCEYRCSGSSNLKLHIRIKHKLDKKYSCDVCEYKSVTKSKLNVHRRKHTGEKPYQCDLCDYKCKVSGILKNHIRAKHTHEKNYSCDVCECKFVTKSELNIHLWKHNGEKPHKCEFCDYRFSQSCHLKYHIRAKHTNEKKYSCDVCEHKCVTKRDLNVHIRKHTGEKPYKCELCDYRCSVSGSLKKHIGAKHNDS